MQHYYRIAGLTVASQISLPGQIEARSDDLEPADVSIRHGAVPQTLGHAMEHVPTWEIDGDRFLFRVANVGRFLISGGCEIVVEAVDGCPGGDLAIFLAGTVFGILLHQRGRFVLHASAVRVGARAVLFCGASGSGKSTLAAALGKSGHALVSDDICALSVGDRVASVEPDGRQIKLWSQSIEGLVVAASKGPAVRTGIEKFYVEPAETHPGGLALGAIYVLREDRPPLKQGIQKPNILDATKLLRANAYRPLLVSRMNQGEHYFRSAAGIANSVGVFHLTRPLDFAALPAVIGMLKDHWAEIGLSQSAVDA
jgi:hypothetical protein